MEGLYSSLAGLSYVFILLIILRSLFNLKNLKSNTKWIFATNLKYKRNINKKYSEFFLICIPMLREQKVAAKTLNYFSHLNYPKSKYKILVVTTNKEIFDQKKENKELESLAKDVFYKVPFKKIEGKYKYLIPPDALFEVMQNLKSKNLFQIKRSLIKIFNKTRSTQDLALTEASKINRRLKTKLIEVFNYPYTNGVMSHQINYAVKKLTNSGYDKAIFAVYNADSRPNKDTLKFVSHTLNQFEKETGVKPNIVQQSSLFTLNYNDFPKTLEGYVLKSSALFQTKWTLIHELTRFRSQSKSVISNLNSLLSTLFKTKISHCVGHGLFVRFEVLKKEYLPTETINEDLPFGYYQCCKGEPILPLPLLENSEAPRSFKGLLRQKLVWFTPYLEYLLCRKRVLDRKKYRSRLEVDILTMQALTTGLIWLFQSAILFFPLFIGFVTINPGILLLWGMSILLYWFLPVFTIVLNLKKLEKIAEKSTTNINWSDVLIASLAGLIVLFTHSIGPIISIKSYAFAKLTNRHFEKYKTER